MLIGFVIILMFKNVLCDLKLLILHTNDMHSRFKQTDTNLRRCEDNSFASCFGGFARIHSTVKKFKLENQATGRSTIFLDAGDTFQGTPYYSNYKWRIVAKFMNALNVDVMSLGNHEFDDGIDGLAPYINHLKIPVVCCNLDISQESTLQGPNLSPSKILFINGTKVGVIGYITPNIPKMFTGNVTIYNEIPRIRAEAKRLINKGINVLIALGHSGYDKDLSIAREVEEIDVVVGGHTHTFLYSGEPPDKEIPMGRYPTVVFQPSGKRVPVVQAFYGTKYLGYLELNFDDMGNLKSFEGSPVLLNGSYSQSLSILQLLDPYEKELTKKTQRILGYTHVLLDISNLKCKMSECNLGNLITDAYVDYMADHCQSSEGWSAAAIGMTQGGSIRSSIDSVTGGRNGSITLEDVMTVIPFGNRIVLLKLPGNTILQVLEHAVARYEHTKTANAKEFLQVSGLRVTYDLDRISGKRVTQVNVLCADCKIPRFDPLIRSKNYGVVTTEFLAQGGDGFFMLTGHVPECVSDDVDYMVVANYIEAYSPLNPQLESRITIVRSGNNIVIMLLLASFVVAFFLYFFVDGVLCRTSSKLRNFLLYEENVKSVSIVRIKSEECERLIDYNS